MQRIWGGLARVLLIAPDVEIEARRSGKDRCTFMAGFSIGHTLLESALTAPEWLGDVTRPKRTGDG